MLLQSNLEGIPDGIPRSKSVQVVPIVRIITVIGTDRFLTILQVLRSGRFSFRYERVPWRPERPPRSGDLRDRRCQFEGRVRESESPMGGPVPISESAGQIFFSRKIRPAPETRFLSSTDTAHRRCGGNTSIDRGEILC